jgi:hypothetical protein
MRPPGYVQCESGRAAIRVVLCEAVAIGSHSAGNAPGWVTRVVRAGNTFLWSLSPGRLTVDAESGISKAPHRQLQRRGYGRVHPDRRVSVR